MSLLLAVLVWPRHPGGTQQADRRLQVAVLRDGFVMTHVADVGRRVVELERDGNKRRDMTLRHAGDRRVVGTRGGTAIAWQDGKRVHLARIDDERGVSTWGKSVRQLCDGVASNDARFGVGWLEADDTVWVVHGPLAANTAAEVEEPIVSGTELARSDWCGVASGEQNIALLWRSADQLLFTMCTKKRCSSLPARFALDRRLPLLGFGCLRDACLIASRDDVGTIRLAYLGETSRLKWSQPLAAATSAVSIIGVGDRAFAVGYATDRGGEVFRFDRDGQSTSVWRDAASTGPPSLAWSSGRLLIAHYHGDALAHEIVPLQR